MHKMMLEIPTRIEAKRRFLHSCESGDGPWFDAMNQKNRKHIAQYETENVVMSIAKEQDAEVVVRELAADWWARWFRSISIYTAAPIDLCEEEF